LGNGVLAPTTTFPPLQKKKKKRGRKNFRTQKTFKGVHKNIRGKMIIKGATQVNEHSLNFHFVCLKYHKGNIIVWIFIFFGEYFPLITNFTCSKLDKNQKCFYMFKALKHRKWIVFVFFKGFYFFTKCAPFLLKIGTYFNIYDLKELN
jgi:hypothetical protein